VNKGFFDGAFGEPGTADIEEEEGAQGAWGEELDLAVVENGDHEDDDLVVVEKGLSLESHA
jgi:hypothetical protein